MTSATHLLARATREHAVQPDITLLSVLLWFSKNVVVLIYDLHFDCSEKKGTIETLVHSADVS